MFSWFRGGRGDKIETHNLTNKYPEKWLKTKDGIFEPEKVKNCVS